MEYNMWRKRDKNKGKRLRERERERESNKDKNRAEKALLHRKEMRSDEDLRERYFNNRM